MALLLARHGNLLWTALGLLAAPSFDSLGQPAAAQLSVPGAPGVATQRAVVNFAELPQQEAGAVGAFDPMLAGGGIKGASSETNWPPITSSFLGFKSDGDFPPDTHGAVGLNHLVASVNNRLRVQDRAGNILSTVSYANFWAPLATSADFCCDHRVLYEPFDDRWIIVGQTWRGAPRPSMLLGVSQTGDPMGRWNVYRIEVADVDPADQLWPDYPQIAFNKDWIVAQVKIFQGNFTLQLSQIYVFNKTNLYAGGPGLFTRFEQSNDRANRVFAFPVMSFDPSLSTMYLLAQDGGPHGSGVTPGTTNISTLAQIYTITGTVGSEVLTEGPTVTTTNEWDFNPPGGFATGNTNLDFAPQLGSPQKISVHRAFIMGAVYRNGSIWAVQHVFLPAGGSPTRAAIQWFQLSPDGTILQRGMIDDPTGVNFYSWASMSVNQFNDVLIGYSRFASNQYASANYSFRFGTDPPNTLRGDTVFKAGEASYYLSDGTRNRWGDYSATVVDPLNDTDLWTIQEYAASPANTWGTWWGRVAATARTLPLLITSQPQSLNIRLNANATNTVSVSSPVPVHYQWRFNGTNLVGTDSNTFVLAGVQLTNEGNYSVEVSNEFGLAVSSNAALVVLIDPLITIAPVSQSVVAGGSATFSVAFTGNPMPIGVEWRQGSVQKASNVVSRLQDFFTLTNAQQANGGTWRVIVRNLARNVAGGENRTFNLTVLADSDGDGLPDVWETAYPAATNAAEDADLDGLTNLQEYQAGTDPQNSQSYLRVENIAHVAGSNVVSLRFTAVAGKTYTIQRRATAQAGDWSRLVDVLASPTNRLVEVIATNGPAANAQLFYRLATPRVP